MVKKQIVPEWLQETVRGPGGQEVQRQVTDVQHVAVVPLTAAASLRIQTKFCLYIVEINRRGFSLDQNRPAAFFFFQQTSARRLTKPFKNMH